MENNLIKKFVLSVIGSLAMFGCACPKFETHFRMPEGDFVGEGETAVWTKFDPPKKAPQPQSTLEAIQCATKPTEDNFFVLPVSTPIWLATRGIYRVVIPADQRRKSY